MDEQPYMDLILLESFDEICNGEMEEVLDLSNPSMSLESNFHGMSSHDFFFLFIYSFNYS